MWGLFHVSQQTTNHRASVHSQLNPNGVRKKRRTQLSPFGPLTTLDHPWDWPIDLHCGGLVGFRGQAYLPVSSAVWNSFSHTGDRRLRTAGDHPATWCVLARRNRSCFEAHWKGSPGFMLRCAIGPERGRMIS